MILSWNLRHDILFLSHFHLHISMPTSSYPFRLEGLLRKSGLMLFIMEVELRRLG